MTPLDLASLVLIASKTLGEDTAGVLDLLDINAAQTALAEAEPAGAGSDPATGAAALLSALVRHHPLARCNEAMAVAAMTTFLAVNGWQADLDPAGAFPALLTNLAAGQLLPADLTAWLSDHVCLDCGTPAGELPTKEGRMHGWRPGRRRPGRKKGMFQRFTPRARQVVVLSQDEARSLNHNYVGTEHILLGLLREHDGLAARALNVLGISRDAVRQQVLSIIGEGEQPPSGHIPFTPRAKKVLELALREAVNLGHLYIGSEHILLGLIREGEGLACQVLTQLGASLPRVREQVLQLLYSPSVAARELVAAPGIRDLDARIAQTGYEKDTAIDARDFDHAAELRVREKELMAERDRRIAEWSASTDLAELGRELDRLREEVRRLQELLLRHGIEPEEPGERSA
jgi:prophage maintenance system killer protein